MLVAAYVHPSRKARQHLWGLAASNSIAKKRVDEVLGLVGLSEVSNHRVKTYSLGMKQRLGIAAALLGDPHTMILDEPGDGLDPEGIRWIRDFLAYLAKQDRTVFVSSHLLSEMALMADQLVVIGQGRLMEEGSVASIVDRYADKYVRVRSPQLEQLVALVTAKGATSTMTPDRAAQLRGVPVEAVGELAAANNIVLHELTNEYGSLEEQFLNSTRIVPTPTADANGRSVMIDAVRSEWTKLRTTWATVLFIGFAVAIPVIFSVVIAALTKNPQDKRSRELFNNMVLGPCYFTGILRRNRRGTRHRAGRLPQHDQGHVHGRPAPLAGTGRQLIVNTLIGPAVGLVALLLCLGPSSAILNSRHTHMSISDPGVNLSAFIGQVVLCGLFTLAGFGLCSPIRQPAPAIPILLVWPLVGESILFGIINSATGSERATRFLPFREGFRIANSDIFDASSGAFGRLGAGLYFGIFVAIIVAIGWVLTLRRDA